ncbi:MAG: acyl-CoA dehydrogenase family protein [Minwuia sp.]|nr:acyl-CoA dehydrogenase family protein [Minwuia sp.]
MCFDVSLTVQEQELVDIAQDFTAAEITPNAGDWEHDRTYPRDTQMAAAARGLGGVLVPKADGGQGVSYTAACRIFEELANGCMAFTFSMVVHNNFAMSLAANGSALLKDKFLADLIACRRIGAFLLTEPGMGSDAQAVACMARPDNDGWVLDGEKAWISSASHAGVLSIYAQTDPSKGWRGIMCFMIEAEREGVHRVGPYAMAGGHALGTGGFRFEGVRLTRDDVLLEQEAAFKGAMGGIDSARFFVGAMCTGMVSAALERSLEYVAARPAFGQKVADFQGIQWMLADVATDLEAMRLLTYSAADTWDRGGNASMAAAHAKKFATRAALTRLTDCMQVMGANGFMIDEVAARHFASAKMCQFMDGTTEIQNVVISRGLLRNR